MIEVAERFEDYQMVLAGAPSIDDAYYEKFIKGTPVKLVRNKTYPLLSHASAALVTSGTATLETALSMCLRWYVMKRLYLISSVSVSSISSR